MTSKRVRFNDEPPQVLKMYVWNFAYQQARQRNYDCERFRIKIFCYYSYIIEPILKQKIYQQQQECKREGYS